MEWISVNDKLPEVNKAVIVYGKLGYFIAYYDDDFDGGFKVSDINECSSFYVDATHWTELPLIDGVPAIMFPC